MIPQQKKILVIKLGALGDFIYALGPMAAIRKAHPNDDITLLTTKPFERMAQQCGYFNKILIDKRPRMLDIKGWLDLRKTLNNGQFDRIYDLQNNDRTALYFKLLKPKPEWVGAVKGASHRNASPERSAGHAFRGHQQTLAIGGIHNVELDTLAWMKAKSPITPPLPKPYVLLVPGCSVTHPEKRWPVSSYRELVKYLQQNGYHIVLLGSKDDIPVTEAVKDGLDGVIDLTAKTDLTDIPDIARGAAAAIGNDTGPMHMCAMTGCPVIMLFTTQISKIEKHAPPKDKGVKAFEAYDMADISTSSVIEAFRDTEKETRN